MVLILSHRLDKKEGNKEAEKEDVRIGAILDLSGSGSNYGISLQRGLEIAKAKGFDISAKFEQFRIVLNGLIDQFVKPTLTSLGLIDAAKVADVDEINISYLIPKYSNGVAKLIKLPGFTKYFHEKILA